MKYLTRESPIFCEEVAITMVVAFMELDSFSLKCVLCIAKVLKTA